MMEQQNLPAAAGEPAAVPAAVPDVSAPGTYFADKNSFVVVQRVAQLLSASDMVPKQYQGKMPNTVVALEIARRLAIDPFFVMQNLNVIQGKPSWSSQFIIAALNGCKRFKGGLKFEMDNQDKPTSCRAWAVETATGARIDGPTVSLEMAQAEGWMSRPGSKWKTMPDLMLRYRAAAFFGRLYAPDVLLGMYSEEENMEIAAQDLHNESLLVAEAPPEQPAALSRNARMHRWLLDLKGKEGLSELRGWKERNEQKLLDEFGEGSEELEAIFEVWMEMVQALEKK